MNKEQKLIEKERKADKLISEFKSAVTLLAETKHALQNEGISSLSAEGQGFLVPIAKKVHEAKENIRNELLK